MTTAYVESSALAKLVIHELETPSLARALAAHRRRVCSDLGTVEVTRAAGRADGVAGIARARALFLMVDTIPIDAVIVGSAAQLEPWSLRSLDAIHVATAASLVGEDVIFYSYDQRAIQAAGARGLVVASPSG